MEILRFPLPLRAQDGSTFLLKKIGLLLAHRELMNRKPFLVQVIMQYNIESVDQNTVVRISVWGCRWLYSAVLN